MEAGRASASPRNPFLDDGSECGSGKSDGRASPLAADACVPAPAENARPRGASNPFAGCSDASASGCSTSDLEAWPVSPADGSAGRGDNPFASGDSSDSWPATDDRSSGSDDAGLESGGEEADQPEERTEQRATQGETEFTARSRLGGARAQSADGGLGRIFATGIDDAESPWGAPVSHANTVRRAGDPLPDTPASDPGTLRGAGAADWRPPIGDSASIYAVRAREIVDALLPRPPVGVQDVRDALAAAEVRLAEIERRRAAHSGGRLDVPRRVALAEALTRLRTSVRPATLSVLSDVRRALPGVRALAEQTAPLHVRQTRLTAARALCERVRLLDGTSRAFAQAVGCLSAGAVSGGASYAQAGASLGAALALAAAVCSSAGAFDVVLSAGLADVTDSRSDDCSGATTQPAVDSTCGMRRDVGSGAKAARQSPNMNDSRRCSSDEPAIHSSGLGVMAGDGESDPSALPAHERVGPLVVGAVSRLQTGQRALVAAAQALLDGALYGRGAAPASVLREAAGAVDAVRPRAAGRDALCVWYVERQLAPYVCVYRAEASSSDSADSASGIAGVPGRFAWLRRLLAEWDGRHAAIFPAAWRLDERLCVAFCAATRRDLRVILNADAGAGGAYLRHVAAAVAATGAAESGLRARFPGADVRLRDAFEASAALYALVEAHDARISAALPSLCADAAGARLLFVRFRDALRDVLAVSSGRLVLDLAAVFVKHLCALCRAYVRRAEGAASPLGLCGVALCASYCQASTAEMGAALASLVDAGYAEALSFASSAADFGVVAAAAAVRLAGDAIAAAAGAMDVRVLAGSGGADVCDASQWTHRLGGALGGVLSAEVCGTLRDAGDAIAASVACRVAAGVLDAFDSRLRALRGVSPEDAQRLLLDLEAVRSTLLSESVLPAVSPPVLAAVVARGGRPAEALLKALLVAPAADPGAFAVHFVHVRRLVLQRTAACSFAEEQAALAAVLSVAGAPRSVAAAAVSALRDLVPDAHSDAAGESNSKTAAREGPPARPRRPSLLEAGRRLLQSDGGLRRILGERP